MGQTEISNYQSAGIRKSFVYSAYIIISIALACALQLAINVVLSSLKTGYYLVFASYLLSTIFLLPVNSRCNLSGKVVFSIILGPAFALCIFGLIVNKYLFPLKFPIETILTLLACYAGYLLKRNRKKGIPLLICSLSIIVLFNFFFHGQIAYYTYTNLSKLDEEGATLGMNSNTYFYTTNEELISSDIFKTKKAVLLNFEFINCIPCARKKPYFEKLYQHYKNNNDVLIASICYGRLSPFEEWKNHYLTKNKGRYNFTLLYDSACIFSDLILLRKKFPQEFILTSDGNIIEGPSSFMNDIGDFYIKQNIKKIDSIINHKN